MGLVINPIGYRIGYTKQWNDSWYLHRMNYPVFVHKSLELKLLLEYCLRRRPWNRSFWVYSHISYYYYNNKFFVSVFFYDGTPQQELGDRANRFRWRLFRNLRLVSKFKKMHLLDQARLYQRFWLLCHCLNFKPEGFLYDNIKWRLSKKELGKIKGLKKNMELVEFLEKN